MSFKSYRYRAIVEWTDPDDGQPRRADLDLTQISMGRAGRIMATRTDGDSHNFAHFDSVRIVRIEEPY